MCVRSAVLVAATAVVALAGCGGGSSSPDPVADVHQAVHAFYSDEATGNYAGACALKTASDRKLNLSKGETCAQSYRLLGPVVPAEKAQLEHLANLGNSARVSIHGDTATVFGKAGTRLFLTKQGDRWLISGGRFQ